MNYKNFRLFCFNIFTYNLVSTENIENTQDMVCKKASCILSEEEKEILNSIFYIIENFINGLENQNLYEPYEEIVKSQQEKGIKEEFYNKYIDNSNKKITHMFNKFLKKLAVINEEIINNNFKEISLEYHACLYEIYDTTRRSSFRKYFKKELNKFNFTLIDDYNKEILALSDKDINILKLDINYNSLFCGEMIKEEFILKKL